MRERWLAIAGYEGAYEVSNLGHVRSLPGGRRRGVVLKPVPAGRGYLTVQLCMAGAIERRYLHHLVAAAFVGPRPDGLDALHSNGDFLDNRAVNLRYGTVSANNRDAISHGRNREASRTHCGNGHEFTADNTYVETSRSPDGGVKRRRRCRICRTATARITYLRSRARSA